MKLFTIFLFITMISLNANAEDINGIWQDSTSTSFSNCTAIFAVKNDSVFMTHYLEFNTIPFVEYGKGVIKGDSIIYSVTVSKQIPGWSTAGVHRLKSFDQGKTLRGNYHDNKGNSGTLVFKRKK